MDTLETIRTRRSVRSYMDEDVSNEDVLMLLRAAMQAPSGMDRQPWHFVVIRKPETRAALAEGLPYAKMAAHAPVVIVICADSAEEPTQGLAVEDGAAAAENILLAAHSKSLGAVWTALYPYDERMAVARRLLKLPDAIIPLTLVPVGHPAHPSKPADRFRPDRIHLETW